MSSCTSEGYNLGAMRTIPDYMNHSKLGKYGPSGAGWDSDVKPLELYIK